MINLSARRNFELSYFQEAQTLDVIAPIPQKETDDLDEKNILDNLRTSQEELMKKFGGRLMTLGLKRKFRALKVHLDLVPKPLSNSEFQKYLTICEVLSELSKKKYKLLETRKTLKTLFSLTEFHPGVSHFYHFFQELAFKNECNSLATFKKKVKSGRTVYFLMKGKSQIAKYIKLDKLSKTVEMFDDGKVFEGFKNEMRAYRLSELFNDGVVPMTIQIYRRGLKGCVQKFLPHAQTIRQLLIRDMSSGSETLSSLPLASVHQYLLHEFLIGNNDAGTNNVMINGNHLYNIDNEFSFPPNNYIIGKDNEGRGGAKITLMALPQAKIPLTRATLLLYASPIVSNTLERAFFRMYGKPSYAALIERAETIARLSRFALDFPKFKLTPEKIFFELFTHEEFVYFHRLKGCSDLDIFGVICHYFPDDKRSLPPRSIFNTSVEEGRFRSTQKIGLPNLQKARNFVCDPKSKHIQIMEIDPTETNITAFKDTSTKKIIPEDLPLLLKGTPRIVARRIMREYPGFPLWIVVDKDNKLQMYFSLPDNYRKLYKEYQKTIHSEKTIFSVKIDDELLNEIRRQKFDNKYFCTNEMSTLYVQLRSFPSEEIALIALWGAHARKRGVIFKLKENRCILDFY